MLDELYSLYRQVNPDKVVIDGSAADVVGSFKARIGERVDYLREREDYRKQGLEWEKLTKVLPLFFGRQNKTLLTHAKNLVDNELL